MLHFAALVFFPLLMIWAAVSDMMTMTISNRISILLVALFLLLAFATGHSWQAIGTNLACGALVLVITFTMFAFGWIGGGDAKLAAAIAVWFGFADILSWALASAMFGGLLTLVLLQLRRMPLPQFMLQQAWIARLHHPETGIPYGIALAAAGLYLYTDTTVWQAAL